MTSFLSEVKVLTWNLPVISLAIMAGFYMWSKILPCVTLGTSQLKSNWCISLKVFPCYSYSWHLYIIISVGQCIITRVRARGLLIWANCTPLQHLPYSQSLGEHRAASRTWHQTPSSPSMQQRKPVSFPPHCHSWVQYQRLQCLPGPGKGSAISTACSSSGKSPPYEYHWFSWLHLPLRDQKFPLRLQHKRSNTKQS